MPDLENAAPISSDWKPGQPLRLETENYVLRSLTMDDLGERYQSWADDAELMRHFGSGDMSVRRMRKRLPAYNNRDAFHLGIFCKRTGRFIGYYFVYVTLTWGLARTSVLIGDRDYWGTGAVLETRAALLDFLFDTVDLERVWGRVNAQNTPAVFNYKAHGFQVEGVLRDAYMLADGTRTDQVVFGLMREEWHEQRARGA